MWQRVKDTLADNCLLAVFMAVYLIAWTSNALSNMRFNLQDLGTLAWLLGGQHGINSVFNTSIPLVGQWRQGGAVNASGKPGGHPDNG